MPLSEFLFSFKGRINRLQYLCYLLMCLLSFGFVSLIAAVVHSIGLFIEIWNVLLLFFILVWLVSVVSFRQNACKILTHQAGVY